MFDSPNQRRNPTKAAKRNGHAGRFKYTHVHIMGLARLGATRQLDNPFPYG